MRSKYILLFSVSLLLIISTFLLAQDREIRKKVPPGQVKQKQEKSLKDNQTDKKSAPDGIVNNEKGKGKYNTDDPGNRSISIKEYTKAKKIKLCHKEGESLVTIEVNENALDAHLAHGDVRGECVYSDEGEPDDFINTNRSSRSRFYSAAVEAEDLIALTIRRVEEARNKLELATQRITTLRSNPDIDINDIQEKTEAIDQVNQVINELEQLISTTRLKLQQDRKFFSDLRVL